MKCLLNCLDPHFILFFSIPSRFLSSQFFSLQIIPSVLMLIRLIRVLRTSVYDKYLIICKNYIAENINKIRKNVD